MVPFSGWIEFVLKPLLEDFLEFSPVLVGWEMCKALHGSRNDASQSLGNLAEQNNILDITEFITDDPYIKVSFAIFFFLILDLD